MSSHDPESRPEKRGYHHGHLRQSLIEAAETLIAERGPGGFSLSDAAKMAGVSVAAPYRHFKDRSALLAEMCRIGSEKLTTRLGEALRRDGFSAMGAAYIAFAREEPAYYEALFNSGMKAAESPLAGRDDSFSLLQASVSQQLGQEGQQARLAAFLVFALSHGVASLTKPGRSVLPQGAPTPEWFLTEGVGALLTGLTMRKPVS